MYSYLFTKRIIIETKLLTCFTAKARQDKRRAQILHWLNKKSSSGQVWAILILMWNQRNYKPDLLILKVISFLWNSRQFELLRLQA